MRQADIMMQTEGDAWLARNRERLGKRDVVSEMIEEYGIVPTAALEIGCANGWRLAKLRDRYGCKVLGVEPSHVAAEEAAELKIPVWCCTATALPILSRSSDLVIYGFCLYLTDPAEWFKIVAEGDRVLQDGGHLIIHDFAESHPFVRKYEHCDGVMSYHVDFARFWLANPLYSLVRRKIYVGDEMVTVLKKHPVSSIEVRE